MSFRASYKLVLRHFFVLLAAGMPQFKALLAKDVLRSATTATRSSLG